MKKLIAISVMLALVAGAAFAEVAVGGQFFVGGQFLNGTNVEKTVPGTAAIANDHNTAFKFSFGNSDAGGRLKFRFDGMSGNSTAGDHDWFGYWKPIPQLRLQVGRDSDGNFGTAQITGWGFVGDHKNSLGALNEYSGPVFGLAHSRTGYYPGTGATPNFQVSVFPVDGLAVNLWVPFTGAANAGARYSKFEAQVTYNFADVGRATLSYQNRPGYLRGSSEPDAWWGSSDQTETSKIWGSFFLTAVEGMAFDLGIAYHFPLSNEGKERSYEMAGQTLKEATAITNYPIEIGFGYRITLGDFGFKLRSGFELGASTSDGKKTFTDDSVTRISVNILPSYKIGALTAYLYSGLGIQSVADYKKTGALPGAVTNKSNSVASWWINPYLNIPAGDFKFQVGLRFYSDGVKAQLDGKGGLDGAKVNWEIPFGFAAYF